MTQATTTIKATTVTRMGDWVIPVQDDDGNIIYALQINKTQAEKDNIAEIYQAYVDNGVKVLTYDGKGNKPVYLVDATQKLKAQRASASVDEMVAEMVALGVDEMVARQAISNAKAKKAEKAKAAKA